MTTHRDPWPAGTPAWADLTIPSLDDAAAFYGPLLGWELVDGGAELGGYTFATVSGRRVAGLGEGSSAGTPAWCVYLASDDAVAGARSAVAAGARELVAPTNVPALGTMAVLADPTGAVVGLWQAGALTGWQVAQEAGAVVWVESMSHDQPTALAFYRSVTGLGAQDMSGRGFVYAALAGAAGPVAGVGAYGTGAAADDEPGRWTVYVGVRDTDEVVARVTDLGGTVDSGPQDSPFGRVAHLRGPFGERFAVISVPDELRDEPPGARPSSRP
ncbi:VOC family protein [Cellulomonas sp. HZM]|uniref:VOC family protein n=1 Tax=Cellulomonas sp. HZM TaxID=1454010 RepID=UPI0006910E72|nr:VOC family protein [Cellulomonas sp. HZM]